MTSTTVLAIKWLAVIALGAITAFAVIWYSCGGRVFSVQTGSMQPVLVIGDAVFVRPIAADNVAVGQIVSFHDRQVSSLIITHRIVAVDRQHAAVTTKGDHNPQADLPISDRQIIGQVTTRGPYLGTVLTWLRRPIGLILAVYVPIATIICLETMRWQNRRSIYYGR